MNDLYAVLLSWATTLSGYPMPDVGADIVPVSHQVLVERACGGRECKVLGWFPPGGRIYVDERLAPGEDLLAASIVVHEMVHYLQYKAGAFDGLGCAGSIALEREAYAIQREFLLRYGVYRPVGVNSHRVGCTLAHEGDLDMGHAASAPVACADNIERQGQRCGAGRDRRRVQYRVYGTYIEEHRRTTSWLPKIISESAKPQTVDQGVPTSTYRRQ